MKNSDLLSLMTKRLGNRTAPTLRATVLTELNEKIRQLELGATLPWFIEDRWEADTVANVDSVALPSDFLREVEEGRFKLRDTTQTPAKWTRLTKVDLEMLEDETDNADAQLPKAYALFGEKVYFGPIPDKAYSFKLPYYKRTTAVADDANEISNKWLLNFEHYVTLEVISFVATTHTRDAKLVQSIQPELQKAQAAFWRAVEARQHVNREYLLDNSES